MLVFKIIHGGVPPRKIIIREKIFQYWIGIFKSKNSSFRWKRRGGMADSSEDAGIRQNTGTAKGNFF